MEIIETKSTVHQNIPRPHQGAPTQSVPGLYENSLSLETALTSFLRILESKNRSLATMRAYSADVSQFIAWLRTNNMVIENPSQVEKTDICDFLACLGSNGVTGISRARKLAAVREYFRFLDVACQGIHPGIGKQFTHRIGKLFTHQIGK